MESPNNIPDWLQFEDLDSEPEVPSYKFYDDSITLHYDDPSHTYYRFDENAERVDVPGVTTVLGIIDKSKPLMLWAVKLAVETMRTGLVDQAGFPKDLATEELNALLEDARTKHTQNLEDAGSIGSKVHNHIEGMIKYALANNNGYLVRTELPEDSDPRLVNCITALMDWAESHDVQFVFTEKKVYSKLFDCAGTCDGLAWVSSCSDPTCCNVSRPRQLDVVDFKTSRGIRTTYRLQVAIYQFCLIEEEGTDIKGRWILKLDKETGKLTKRYCPPETFEADLECFINALNLYRTVNAVEDRDRAENAEQKAFAKSIRDAQKAAAQALEKQAKADEKARVKAEKKALKDAQDAHYKQLREQGMKAAQAKQLAYAKNEPVFTEMDDVMNPELDMTDKAKITPFVESDLGTTVVESAPMMIPVQGNSDSMTKPGSSFLEFTVDDSEVNLFDLM